ncbi:hypothetical protein Tco_0437757 [Tanacetum coccineum]
MSIIACTHLCCLPPDLLVYVIRLIHQIVGFLDFCFTPEEISSPVDDSARDSCSMILLPSDFLNLVYRRNSIALLQSEIPYVLMSQCSISRGSVKILKNCPIIYLDSCLQKRTSTSETAPQICVTQSSCHPTMLIADGIATLGRFEDTKQSYAPNMVPNIEKLMEVFIGGLPRSIEGNVTASRPQTLEEATNIAHRLMDQIIKRDSVQETIDIKRKFEWIEVHHR